MEDKENTPKPKRGRPPIEGRTHKKCPSCEETKEISCFYKRKNTNYTRSWCYDCERDKKGSKRAATKEERVKEAEMNMHTGTKTCMDCRETLPLSRFSKAFGSLDGHSNRCSVCTLIKRRGISGSTDEDRVRKWKEREAMFREISESAPRKKPEKGIYAWEDP